MKTLLWIWTILGMPQRYVKLLYYKIVFKQFYWSDVIVKPISLTPRFIEFDERVYIGHHARIQGVDSYNRNSYNPLIRFHEGITVQQNLHLTCAQRIEIGANTAIAANVTITDINHPYEDITMPVEQQNIEVNPVYIGEDCKIYNNVVILPGVHIGRHCVIGANSVVNGNIPDNSIAVGAPARVVKKFDKNKQKWLKVG